MARRGIKKNPQTIEDITGQAGIQQLESRALNAIRDDKVVALDMAAHLERDDPQECALLPVFVSLVMLRIAMDTAAFQHRIPNVITLIRLQVTGESEGRVHPLYEDQIEIAEKVFQKYQESRVSTSV